ncbi:MAG: STAS domain-containing protein [Symploca sp. SIO2E9]|nr:STAS domain-containing protein [Symploca sp. SIO2E9]
MVDPVSEADFKVMFLEDIPVVHIPVRLSVLEAVALKTKCQQLLQKTSLSAKIIFDFGETTFIDSSGVGALVSNHKLAREKGVEILLSRVTPQVMAVLAMTSLDKILNIEPLAVSAQPLTKSSENQLPTTHPSVRSWVKRVIDIVGGCVGLGITAIVFIPILVAVQLDDPGPVFFSQTRLGWMGKPFKIWKFRSMYIDAEARKHEIENQADGKVFKNENDPRITQVGRFLRRTSLDELPQFLNVVRGEMSLVGTRPPTPNEVEIYEVPEWQRLDVKPGMTGEWQVNGRSSVRNFEDIIQLDLRYQRNWSLLYDLKLIIKTIFIVFSKNSGAS